MDRHGHLLGRARPRALASRVREREPPTWLGLKAEGRTRIGPPGTRRRQAGTIGSVAKRASGRDAGRTKLNSPAPRCPARDGVADRPPSQQKLSSRPALGAGLSLCAAGDPL
jgi:hypothetical protein